jgi:D-beta-D-heptose 7-phosphate kinase/D-beta-D-heptose 1-phosphate adenosyltransferase
MTKILVIGELCEDIFVYGQVTKICPEAPVPIFNPKYEKTNLGMSGNVVQNLRSLDKDLIIEHWHQSEKITKKRIVDEKSNQMIVRIDDGELSQVSPMYKLSTQERKIIEGCDAVIICDYDKGYLSETMIQDISKLNKFVVLDTKKKLELETVTNLKFIKLNESEYNNNLKLVSNHPEKFLITLGSQGCLHDGILYPSQKPQTTIDVSGAGDTFVASFTYKMLESNNLNESLRFANEMSSIVVSKRGVATPK